MPNTMKVFKLEIIMENDAFGSTAETRADMTALILRRVAKRVGEDQRFSMPLHDPNGNWVGETKVIGRRWPS